MKANAWQPEQKSCEKTKKCNGNNVQGGNHTEQTRGFAIEEHPISKWDPVATAARTPVIGIRRRQEVDGIHDQDEVNEK